MILPLEFIGDSLRSISLNGEIGNTIAVIIYLLIVVIPIGILIYRVFKKEVFKYEYVFSPLLSIVLGYTIFIFINPHLLYDSLNPVVKDIMPFNTMADLEMILKSGVAYVLYLLIIINLLFKTFLNKKFDSIKLIKALLDITIIALAFSTLSLSLSELIINNQAIDIAQEVRLNIMSYILLVVINLLIIYLLNMFRGFIVELYNDGFQYKLSEVLIRLHKLSFLLLVFTLFAQIVKNLYQLIVLEKFMNIEFTFDVPIPTILLTCVIYVLSKYISEAIEIKKENELII
jgi:hypothetical protein